MCAMGPALVVELPPAFDEDLGVTELICSTPSDKKEHKASQT